LVFGSVKSAENGGRGERMADGQVWWRLFEWANYTKYCWRL